MTNKKENTSIPENWISIVLQNAVAANLILILMLLAGLWGAVKLNIQQIPNISIPVITVTIPYPGANAEDVENSITYPIEKKLKEVPGLDRISSFSTSNASLVFLQFQSGINLQEAYEETKKQVDATTGLPADSEKPIVSKIEPYETVAKLLIRSNAKPQELRDLVNQIERELLQAGIAKIVITGLEDDIITVEVPISSLTQYGITLNQISSFIRSRSFDAPAGNIGQDTKPQLVRTKQQSRTVSELANIPIITSKTGSVTRLGDIATLKKTSEPDAVSLEQRGKPVITITIQRTQNANTLTSANIVTNWLKNFTPKLPKDTAISSVENNWSYIAERIELLIKNGLSGLVLICILLVLFLGWRIALWVAIGIPTAFIASLFILNELGSTINMISSFAFIMSLGIIVDDAIVVAEETETQFFKTSNGLLASYLGAKRMLKPVMASSLTTLCAFIPLLTVGGVGGDFLVEIPIVVICVILASLIECFLILPGHLHHSLKKAKSNKDFISRHFSNYFNWFRDHVFFKIVKYAINYRLVTLSSVTTAIILTAGMVYGGRINFQFFPNFASEVIFANVEFKAGTPQSIKTEYMRHLEDTLWQTNKEFTQKGDKNPVKNAVIYNNTGVNSIFIGKGERNAALNVELSSVDSRSVTNEQFIKSWQEKIQENSNIDTFRIQQPAQGPPTNQLSILLSGAGLETLKKASVDLQNTIKSFDGTLNVVDNIPAGQEQIIYKLTSEAKAIGLTLNEINSQVSSMINGITIQKIQERNQEVAIKLSLPSSELNQSSNFENLPIIVNKPNGETEILPLISVVDLKTNKGYNRIPHVAGQLSLEVSADVDSNVGNEYKITEELASIYLPKLVQNYGIKYEITSGGGRAGGEQRTINDIEIGGYIALFLIYIVLAWMFSSYLWPIAIMSAIPLGLIGVFFGHYIMGLDITLFSLFGIFGLSGIVINDSIILFVRYKELKAEYENSKTALMEACRQRLRAVVLTSLTTIGGLSPILFETSVQAQVLKPIAATIVFGLLFSTVLILIVIPALLSLLEDIKLKFNFTD